MNSSSRFITDVSNTFIHDMETKNSVQKLSFSCEILHKRQSTQSSSDTVRAGRRKTYLTGGGFILLDFLLSVVPNLFLVSCVSPSSTVRGNFRFQRNQLLFSS